MKIQINTDNNIDASGPITRQVESAVNETLARFSEQITRVEVHLSDANASKAGGNDKRCLIEARLAGLKPLTASHDADTLDDAIDGAAEKLKRSLESTLGRLGDPKGRTSFGGDQTI